MSDDWAWLETAIGYRFVDSTHLRDALTHRSFRNERPRLAPRDNERMEFLGDAILDLAASELLFERFPDAREGELSRRRADLVCERTLATMARDLDLGPHLRLGKGEEKTGGREKPRLLASALEAIVAAILLDADTAAATAMACRLLGPHLDAEEPGARDFKSRLQEVLQATGQPAPTYPLLRQEGPDHDQVFHVEVRVHGELLGKGSGSSKLRAEQRAAEAALRDRESR